MIKELGYRLKARRLELELTLEDLSELTEIKTSTISRYENGEVSEPNFYNIAKIADKLNLSLDYIYKGKLDQQTEAQNRLKDVFDQCLSLPQEDIEVLSEICERFIDLEDYNSIKRKQLERKVKRSILS